MPDAKWYANWVRMLPAETAPEKMRNLEAADLIESLSAELEYVKRERDALLRELKTKFGCEMCTHQAPKGFDDYISNDCMDCINFCNWQWRGVKEG